mmetsp:Transcript_19327/g.42282  ORF Transcript_19327/g.42282 Transcript_19327/m.42282 type:complete len:250 (-) Transcript_19327:245-994(-)
MVIMAARVEHPSTPRGLEDDNKPERTGLTGAEANISEGSRQNNGQPLNSREDTNQQPPSASGKGGQACKTRALGDSEADRLAPFECNICFELANDAVITLCGHMYCWECLYRWVSRGHHECPVCKGDVDKDKVIPLYGRGESSRTDKGTKADTGAFSKGPVTPNRPASQRSEPVHDFTSPGSAYVDGSGYGFTLFTGNFLQRGPHVGVVGGGLESFAQDQLTPEMQQQVFLSRVLLMLGSFVIMCLLLF